MFLVSWSILRRVINYSVIFDTRLASNNRITRLFIRLKTFIISILLKLLLIFWIIYYRSNLFLYIVLIRKWNLRNTNAFKLSSLNLLRILLQKLPPTENERSDETDEGFMDAKHFCSFLIETVSVMLPSNTWNSFFSALMLPSVNSDLFADIFFLLSAQLSQARRQS